MYVAMQSACKCTCTHMQVPLLSLTVCVSTCVCTYIYIYSQHKGPPQLANVVYNIRTCTHMCLQCLSLHYASPHTYVHMYATPQGSTTAAPTGSTGCWHSLYGQSQLGVLWVVDHFRVHLNLARETVEIVSAFGLIIVPLILKTIQGNAKELIIMLHICSLQWCLCL